MPFFTTPDDVRLHYEIEGSGPPLVLHLGAGCDADLWRAAGYVEPLSRFRSCILFDHRGHGQSDHPTSVAANHIDRYAADVAALAGHLGYSRISFFGWSNGLQVGLKAADQYPDLFDALVLFGGIGRPATAEQLAASTPVRIAGFREKGWWYILDGMVTGEKLPIPKWFLDRVVATDIEPFIAWSQARPDWNWSQWEAAPRISVPTLLLAGELEDPDDVVAELASLMPNARQVRIPDREHINAFLYSGYVVPRVIDFLNSPYAYRSTASARPSAT